MAQQSCITRLAGTYRTAEMHRGQTGTPWSTSTSRAGTTSRARVGNGPVERTPRDGGAEYAMSGVVVAVTVALFLGGVVTGVIAVIALAIRSGTGAARGGLRAAPGSRAAWASLRATSGEAPGFPWAVGHPGRPWPRFLLVMPAIPTNGLARSDGIILVIRIIHPSGGFRPERDGYYGDMYQTLGSPEQSVRVRSSDCLVIEVQVIPPLLGQ